MKYKTNNKNVINGVFTAKRNGDLPSFIGRVTRANTVENVAYTLKKKKVHMIITTKNTKKMAACESIYKLGKLYAVRVPRVVSKYACNRRCGRKALNKPVPSLKLSVMNFLGKFFTW